MPAKTSLLRRLLCSIFGHGKYKRYHGTVDTEVKSVAHAKILVREGVFVYEPPFSNVSGIFEEDLRDRSPRFLFYFVDHFRCVRCRTRFVTPRGWRDNFAEEGF